MLANDNNFDHFNNIIELLLLLFNNIISQGRCQGKAKQGFFY